MNADTEKQKHESIMEVLTCCTYLHTEPTTILLSMHKGGQKHE